MKLYILRHGETELNRLGIVQGSGVDADLNDRGRAQAQAFFQAYQHLDFELIVTSALRRTHQTVQAFLDKKTPWVQLPDLNEISWGEHEGLPPSPHRSAIYHQTVSEWQRGNLDASLPGGESARALLARVTRFEEWVRTRPERRILVATHGRTMRCLVTHLKGIGPGEMEGTPHVNTGLYIAQHQDGKWTFELENDASHLAGMR
jgi:probable phosphoglycerate mutase